MCYYGMMTELGTPVHPRQLIFGVFGEQEKSSLQFLRHTGTINACSGAKLCFSIHYENKRLQRSLSEE